MYGYGYYGWGMDPTILLLVIGMLLSLAASAKLRSTFAVYKKGPESFRYHRCGSCTEDPESGWDHRRTGGSNPRKSYGSL